jgi:hypothetical protein
MMAARAEARPPGDVGRGSTDPARDGVRRCQAMKIVIQVSPRDSAKAWSLLVRHSPGVALPDRMFVVSDEAVRALREAGIRFSELSREASLSGAAAGERI